MTEEQIRAMLESPVADVHLLLRATLIDLVGCGECGRWFCSEVAIRLHQEKLDDPADPTSRHDGHPWQYRNGVDAAEYDFVATVAGKQPVIEAVQRPVYTLADVEATAKTAWALFRAERSQMVWFYRPYELARLRFEADRQLSRLSQMDAPKAGDPVEFWARHVLKISAGLEQYFSMGVRPGWQHYGYFPAAIRWDGGRMMMPIVARGPELLRGGQ